MFPDKSEEEIKKIDGAYYKAFPGIKTYHDYCYKRAYYNSYTSNLFGIKYYGVSGHNLINMLIQGSSAYYLKWKIAQLYEFFKKNNYKSRFQMNVHDELSWEYHKDDPLDIWFKVKEIMEDWNDTKVPIVAELEVTTTTWGEKKGCDNIEELQNRISP